MSRAPHAPQRHAAETWSAASAMHARVVGAVIMRDLQTRFGGSYLGFLLALLFPLGHIGIVVVIYSILGRSTPLGTDIVAFMATGALPFVIWLYIHRQTMISIQQNRPLLYFPGVAVIDFIVARCAIEILNTTMIVFVVMTTLIMIGHDPYIYDEKLFLLYLAVSYVLGVSTGVFFGVLSYLFPFFPVLGGLIGPLFWVTSGILFLPDNVPEVIQNLIFFFPLSHVVDFVRMSIYSSYFTSYASSTYIAIFIGAVVLASMLAMHLARRFA